MLHTFDGKVEAEQQAAKTSARMGLKLAAMAAIVKSDGGSEPCFRSSREVAHIERCEEVMTSG
jgi:hypothetical protein